jgi:hypothetical protein
MTPRVLRVWTVTTLALVCAAFGLVVSSAYGQAAARLPVCPPGGGNGGVGPWLGSNASWLVPVAALAASTLATGLSNYPKAGGFVRVLRLVASCLSLVPFKDSAGSLKLPVVPSAPPAETKTP